MKTRYAKCGVCGAWRPRRELKITVVVEPLWRSDGPKQYGRECRAGHTSRQVQRSRDLWTRELIDRLTV